MVDAGIETEPCDQAGMCIHERPRREPINTQSLTVGKAPQYAPQLTVIHTAEALQCHIIHLTTKNILTHMITHTGENILVVIPPHSGNVNLPHRLIHM